MIDTLEERKNRKKQFDNQLCRGGEKRKHNQKLVTAIELP